VNVRFCGWAALLIACTESPASPRDGGSPPPRADAAASNLDASSTDATSGSADGGAADPSPCPGGAPLVHYSLTSLAVVPTINEIQLPNLIPNAIITAVVPGATPALRFDFCVNAGVHTLFGLQYQEHSFELPRRFVIDSTVASPMERQIPTPHGDITEIRVPPSVVVTSGIDAAIGGDLSTLRIRLILDDGLLVFGHADFLAVGRGMVGASSMTYTSLTIVVGGLGAGDAFAGLVCPFAQQALSARFAFGTAQFEVEGCSFLGGGETFGYEIRRLSVEDSSPSLMPADRRKFELTTPTELAAALNYRWNHHNACDSFHLALPHADYAASTAPLAGCGTQVPNAPPRMFEDPPNTPVKYRIRYYGGPWVDGEVPNCTHYIIRCE